MPETPLYTLGFAGKTIAIKHGSYAALVPAEDVFVLSRARNALHPDGYASVHISYDDPPYKKPMRQKRFGFV